MEEAPEKGGNCTSTIALHFSNSQMYIRMLQVCFQNICLARSSPSVKFSGIFMASFNIHGNVNVDMF